MTTSLCLSVRAGVSWWALCRSFKISIGGPHILCPPACSKLSCLEALEICNGAITDAGVSALAGLRNLSTLSLGQNPRITDASILQLARATNLVTLNLSRSRVTGAGLMPLARLTVRTGVLHWSVGRVGLTSNGAGSQAEASWRGHASVCIWVFEGQCLPA